jgi:hypothetical protein
VGEIAIAMGFLILKFVSIPTSGLDFAILPRKAWDARATPVY